MTNYDDLKLNTETVSPMSKNRPPPQSDLSSQFFLTEFQEV